MPTDKDEDTQDSNLQSIPETVQDIPTEQLVNADYVVTAAENQDTDDSATRREPSGSPPPAESLIDNSAGSLGADPSGSGYSFSSGYDSPMATRIGDEEEHIGEDTERLREIHEGRHPSDGNHSTREHHRDKKRIAQAICSALPLASPEREEVISVVQGLDLNRFGNQKGVPRVILGVIAVFVDENRADGVQPDQADEIELVQRSDVFRDLCAMHDVSMSDLSTIKQKVRESSIRIGTNSPSRDPALPGPTPLSDRPREYWDHRESEEWIHIARSWEKFSQEFRDAIPDEYREKVEELQECKPWEDEVVTEPANESGDEDLADPIEELDAEIEAEAEAILDDMMAEDDE